MLKVDNSGKGNCMYYAYSISLMYFLRSKNNQDITNNIFNKLNLNDEQKDKLQILLDKKPQREFTNNEIKKTIEPILGKATRNLTAEHTKDEFINNPQSTSLYAASKYGLEYYLKNAAKDRPDLAKLIDNKFNNKDYTEAEIYRVKGMNDGMEKFAKNILPNVTEEFEKQWKEKEEQFKQQNKNLTEKDIEFHKKNILDNIIGGKTIDFFLDNEDQYLNEYKNHLKKEFVWGTEESLMGLHRAIQGERHVRNDFGEIDTTYDNAEICLHLHTNDKSPFQQNGNPEIIINNKGKFHWTSKIPEIIFDNKKAVSFTEEKNSKLKTAVINISKNMLSEIPFNTIYSYADNLFDKKEVPFGDKSIQKEVDFLQKTKLSDIEYDNTDNAHFFTIKNRNTGETIEVSNRQSSRGELRGENLRNLLENEKQQTPDESAYEIITRAVKTPRYSDMIKMFEGSVVGDNASMAYDGESMSKEHFDLFVAILLDRVNGKITNKTIESNLDPKSIRNDPKINDEIWKGINLNKIFDTTKAIDTNLKKIKEKSIELTSRGYPEASQATQKLYSALNDQKNSFIDKKIPIQEFIENCNTLIDTAQKGELKNHRGFLGNIWNGILNALNFLTAGAVTIKPTDSIQKTIEMKKTLSDFMESSKAIPEENERIEKPFNEIKR